MKGAMLFADLTWRDVVAVLRAFYARAEGCFALRNRGPLPVSYPLSTDREDGS